MNKKSFPFILGMFIWNMSVIVVNAGETMSTKLFGTLDYYSVDSADQGYKDKAAELVNQIIVLGDNGTSENDSAPGYGARIGAMWPISERRIPNLGVSLGYVQGPNVKSTVFNNAPTPGRIDLEAKTWYLRFLLEVAQELKLNSRSSFLLGAGVGIASGKTDQQSSSSGSLTYFSPNASKRSAGLSWEISPSFLFHLEQADVFLGVRYAYFPTIKETVDTIEIKWFPFGMFVGLAF